MVEGRAHAQMGHKLWRVLQWEGLRLKSLAIWRKGIFWVLVEGSSLLLVDVWVHTCIATCGNPIKSEWRFGEMGGGGGTQMHSCVVAVGYTIAGLFNILYICAQVVWRPPADAPTGHVTLQQDGANKRYLYCLHAFYGLLNGSNWLK